MLDADLELKESRKAAQDAEAARKAAADEEYRSNLYAADEQYRRDMYDVDSSYASNMAQAEAERKDRDYAAQSAERDAKAAADEEYLKNMYATDAEYSAAMAEAEAAAREAKLKAEQNAAAGKMEAGMSYAENMINSNDAYFDLTGETTNTSVQATVQQYIQKNGAALGNMDDIDAAYANGEIDKGTMQEYYKENASALIKDVKTFNDVEAYVDDLTRLVEEGKMTASEQIKKENELYSSIGHKVDSEHYTVSNVNMGELRSTIELNGEEYHVRFSTAGNKIQNTLNKIGATAKDGELIGFDNEVYVKLSGKWRRVVDKYNTGFIDKYFNYNDKASSPNKISTPSGDAKAENR